MPEFAQHMVHLRDAVTHVQAAHLGSDIAKSHGEDVFVGALDRIGPLVVAHGRALPSVNYHR